MSTVPSHPLLAQQVGDLFDPSRPVKTARPVCHSREGVKSLSVQVPYSDVKAHIRPGRRCSDVTCLPTQYSSLLGLTGLNLQGI